MENKDAITIEEIANTINAYSTPEETERIKQVVMENEPAFMTGAYLRRCDEELQSARAAIKAFIVLHAKTDEEKALLYQAIGFIDEAESSRMIAGQFNRKLTGPAIMSI